MRGNFDKLINGDKPILVDFHATWCGPCKTLAPILKEVAQDINGKARIIKIDVDKNQALAQRFQVRGVPTMIYFKNGEILWRTSGVQTKQKIIDVINEKS